MEKFGTGKWYVIPGGEAFFVSQFDGPNPGPLTEAEAARVADERNQVEAAHDTGVTWFPQEEMDWEAMVAARTVK